MYSKLRKVVNGWNRVYDACGEINKEKTWTSANL